MNEIYSGYEIELNKEENKAYKGKMLKIEGNSYQETRDRVDGTLVSGEFINITDAQDLQIRSFNIKGKGEQETREGYNKLKLEDKTISVGGVEAVILDGKITINGTPETANFNQTIGTETITEAGTYSLLPFKSSTNANIRLIYKINNGAWASGDNNPTFELAVGDILDVNLRIDSTATITNFTMTPMLTLGTESKPYERYGKTPSMEFESPIKSVGDNIQLFDISTITANKFVYADSGEIGASTVSTTSDYIPVIANETYTALLDYETLAQDGPRGIALYDNDKKYISGVTYTSSKKGFTYTPTQSGYLRFSYDNNCTVVKFSKGTSTGPYSPYGMGSVEIIQTNKNLLTKQPNVYYNPTGLTVTDKQIGEFILNGTQKAEELRFFGAYNTKQCNYKLPKGRYKFCAYLSTKEGPIYTELTISDGSSYQQINGTSIEFEITKEGQGLGSIKIPVGSGTYSDVELKMMLTKSTDNETYVPHQSQTKALYTQQPFRSVKDVEDTFAKKMGKWKEEHKIKRLILKGIEAWNREETSNGFIRFNLPLPDIYPYSDEARHIDKIMCSHLKLSTINDWEIIFQYKKVIYLYMNFESVEDLNTKLAELYNAGTPVYVDYVLATPTLIDCTEEQIEQLDYFYEEAKTYEGVNNVYSIDEVKPTITFRYNCLPALPSVEEKSEVESVGDNTNLYKPETMPLSNGLWINQNTSKIVGNSGGWYVIFPCFPKSTYTISRKNSRQLTSSISFVIVETEELPQNGLTYLNSIIDHNATEKTITTSSDTKYLLLLLGSGSGIDDETKRLFIEELKICKGTSTGAYSPYGQGSIKIKHSNENFLEITSAKFTPTVEGWYDFNGISNMYNNTQYINSKTKIRLKAGKYYLSYGKTTNVNTVQIIKVDGTTYGKLIHAKMGVFTLDEDSEIIVRLNVTTINIETSIEDVQISSGTEKKQFKPHQSEEFLLPMQEPFRKEGTYKDLFVKDNEKWYEHHNIFKWIFDGTENWYTVTNGKGIDCYVLALGSSQLARTLDIKSNMLKQTDDIWNIAERKDVVKISSGLNGINILMKGITTLEDFKGTLATLYEEGNPLYVEYVLKTPKLIPCTPQQSTMLDQLENIQLYDGVNYIYTTDGIEPLLTLEIYNMIEDYDLYVSNDGYFGIPGTDIKFLVNFYESNLPTMPEAVEASVRAAGRNGDYVLNTTYEPLPFEIVCYTEDNLTPTQKKEIESKVNRFLNSIKNRTKRIAFEKGEKFYNVKYNGLLTTTNYPAHLKFSIPLKSSESFGKDAYQKVLSGNSTEVSDTVEEVGALITINGPATLPIIALNDYSMEYSTSILEGARIEIDTAKSTATHINSDGVKTNVMRYYNHQFPKIQPGENTLKVLSGVDDENNVTVKWNDLKL